MINLGFSAQVSKLTTTATAPGTLACISIYPSRPSGEKWRRGPRHPSLTIRLTFIRPTDGRGARYDDDDDADDATPHVFFMAAETKKVPKRSSRRRSLARAPRWRSVDQ